MPDSAPAKTIVVGCPECTRLRAADVLGDHSESGHEETYHWRKSYKIVRCRSCSHVQFVTVYADSIEVQRHLGPDDEVIEEPIETTRHYPPLNKRPRPVWMTSDAVTPIVNHLLDEAYKALTNDLPVLSAIALRTVFDATAEALSIDPSLDFRRKLDALASNGITQPQREILDALTDAGSAAAHRGWKPTDTELRTMFDIMENFLHRVFIIMKEEEALRRRAAELAQRTPPRPPRPKKKV